MTRTHQRGGMAFLAPLIAGALALASPPPAAAQAPAQAQPAFGIPKEGVTFETGDTWQ
ncbi:hypothetical protein [Microvirga tunisiensis]|uniref:hypothetical protein n=1 Tax=Microvirga tunisiensis TaxID=2108360 RepID=UPI00129C2B6C|nr:hypothetical protein [Microvirga tunisiensis]